MLKIYDKVQWHVDAGMDVVECVKKMEKVFEFLAEKGWLSSAGQEILDIGIDSSVSIHEKMINGAGKKFMEACYDNVINMSSSEISKALQIEYNRYVK